MLLALVVAAVMRHLVCWHLTNCCAASRDHALPLRCRVLNIRPDASEQCAPSVVCRTNRLGYADADADAFSLLQAYSHNHGIAWMVDSPWFQKDKGDEEAKGSPMPPGPSLCWLLEKAGLQQLQKPLGKCC
jgi:hypothetical protein